MNIRGKFLDRPIAFHRCLVDVTGSVKAALMLSQACYWALRCEGGRFYKSMAEWKDETGLSRKEQEGARAILRRFPFWREEVRKVEHRVYYTVNVAGVAEAVQRGMTMPERGIENAQTGQCTMPETGNVYKEQRLPETTTETTKEGAQRADRSTRSVSKGNGSGNGLFGRVREYAERTWREKKGFKPTWDVKDLAGLARLLRRHPELPLSEFQARWDRYLADGEEFVAKQGHSLAFFCSRFDAYIDRSGLDIPVATPYED